MELYSLVPFCHQLKYRRLKSSVNLCCIYLGIVFYIHEIMRSYFSSNGLIHTKCAFEFTACLVVYLRAFKLYATTVAIFK
jgi:hypothetical protein